MDDANAIKAMELILMSDSQGAIKWRPMEELPMASAELVAVKWGSPLEYPNYEIQRCDRIIRSATMRWAPLPE